MSVPKTSATFKNAFIALNFSLISGKYLFKLRNFDIGNRVFDEFEEKREDLLHTGLFTDQSNDIGNNLADDSWLIQNKQL